jgi:hypothetical protein
MAPDNARIEAWLTRLSDRPAAKRAAEKDEAPMKVAMDSLIQRLDTLRPVCIPRHARPTDGSISKINAHFSIQLPLALVQLARHSRNYDAYFLGLGPDYTSLSHIIRVNSYWRRRRPKRQLPRNLIIVTEGYMDDRFWCLDTSTPAVGSGGYPLQFWCPEELVYPSDERPIMRYPDFESFVEGVIKWSD